MILDAYFVAFPNVKAYMESHRRTRSADAWLHGDAVRSPPADTRSCQNSNFRIRQAG